MDYRGLDGHAYYFDDQDNIHNYTEYTRYFNGGNILDAAEESRSMKSNLRKPRIAANDI